MKWDISLLILFVFVSCNPLAGNQEGSVKGDEFNPGLGSTGPHHLEIVQGQGQVDVPNATLANSLIVKVVNDIGTGVKSARLEVAILNGGGSASSSVLTTNELGQASVDWTLGSSLGSNVLKISGTGPYSGSPSFVSFTASAVSGNPSSTTSTITGSGPVVANGVAQSLVTITILDISSNPVEGVVPTFSASGTGNSYGTCSSSDFSGVSSCTLSSTVAETKNLNLLTPVAVSGGSVSFVSGPPSSIAVYSGNSQSAAYGAALSNPFVAVVRDTSGNTVSGVTVNWAIVTGGGSLSSSSNSTSATGLSSSTLTLGTPGANTATATVNGTSIAVTFSATGTTSSFSSNWPFDIGTSADYTFTSSLIEFSSGAAKLTMNDQVDDDSTTSGFAGGSLVGVEWDSTNGYVRLSQTGTGINNSAFDPSWSPKWASLTSYWKLENNWTDSKGSVSGSVVGGANFTASSKIGSWAANFNGTNSYTTFGNNFNFTTHNFSFSFWVKLNSFATNSAGQGPIPFYKGSYQSNGYYSQFNSAGGLSFATNQSGTYQLTSTTPGIFATGVWYHIVIVRNGSSVRIYVNGIDSTGTAGTHINPVSSGSNFQIGSYNNGQILMNGLLDDFGIWTAPLTAGDAALIYARQSSKYSGVYQSRVMDALSTGQSWSSLSWQPTLPFLKELPDYASGAIQNETSTDYSSLVGSTGATGANDLMNGIKGLWHFNEASATAGGSNDFADASGNVSFGEATGGVTFAIPAQFGRGVAFNGSNGYINLGSPAAINDVTSSDFTFSAWAKVKALPPTTSAVNSSTSIGVILGRKGYHMGLWVNNSGTFSGAILNSSNTYTTLSSASAYPVGDWHHVTMSVNTIAKTLRFYVDGIEVAGSPATYTGTLKNYSGVNYTLGVADPSVPLTNGNYAWFFNGVVDEVGIWGRTLSSAEIHQLYRRGVNRIKYQIRNCATPNAGLTDCTEDPAGANWKGPDGTNQTYFSELNNNSTPLNGSGDVKKGLPSMSFPAFTNPISTGRYFQYRTIFESDDTGTGCDYGSGPTWCSPELKSVRVDPVHYDSSAPTIVGKNGVSYYSLSNFVATLGTGGCSSGVVYNLGVGASSAVATWYWWNGSDWVIASGAASQANTSSDLADHVNTFGSEVGAGKVYVKAFLQSTGTSACALDNIQLSGQQ